jgi:hypothetical protein
VDIHKELFLESRLKVTLLEYSCVHSLMNDKLEITWKYAAMGYLRYKHRICLEAPQKIQPEYPVCRS